MKPLSLMLTIFMTVSSGASWAADEKPGSGTFDSSQFSDIRNAVRQPFVFAELDELQTLMTKLRTWKAANPLIWKSTVESSDNRLDAIANLPAWSSPEEGARAKTLLLRLAMLVSSSKGNSGTSEGLREVVKQLQAQLTEAQATANSLDKFAKRSNDVLAAHKGELEAAFQIYNSLVEGDVH